MDAVEFFKTVNRLCKNQRYCAECPIHKNGMGAAISVRFVDTDGQLDINYAYFSYAVVPACILNPEFLNLRKDMAYVEDVSE